MWLFWSTLSGKKVRQRGLQSPNPSSEIQLYLGRFGCIGIFFRHLPKNNLLSLKLLSPKLVMLVALVSGQRVQTLSLLDLSFTYSVYDSIVFVIPDMTKTSQPGKSASQIVLSEYGQDKRLCVVFCLVAYLLKTLEYRTSSKLFLGLPKPHKAVGVSDLKPLAQGNFAFVWCKD